MDLPTGTVTFLFTDVEGSTRLAKALGAARYGEVLDAHRRLLRDAFRDVRAARGRQSGRRLLRRLPERGRGGAGGGPARNARSRSIAGQRAPPCACGSGSTPARPRWSTRGLPRSCRPPGGPHLHIRAWRPGSRSRARRAISSSPTCLPTFAFAISGSSSSVTSNTRSDSSSSSSTDCLRCFHRRGRSCARRACSRGRSSRARRRAGRARRAARRRPVGRQAAGDRGAGRNRQDPPAGRGARPRAGVRDAGAGRARLRARARVPVRSRAPALRAAPRRRAAEERAELLAGAAALASPIFDPRQSRRRAGCGFVARDAPRALLADREPRRAPPGAARDRRPALVRSVLASLAGLSAGASRRPAAPGRRRAPAAEPGAADVSTRADHDRSTRDRAEARCSQRGGHG